MTSFLMKEMKVHQEKNFTKHITCVVGSIKKGGWMQYAPNPYFYTIPFTSVLTILLASARTPSNSPIFLGQRTHVGAG